MLAAAAGQQRALALARRARRPRPITIPAALNNSRCRTRAKAAWRLTSDARPNPREAASR